MNSEKYIGLDVHQATIVVEECITVRFLDHPLAPRLSVQTKHGPASTWHSKLSVQADLLEWAAQTSVARRRLRRRSAGVGSGAV
jgi:hypothetical protein